MVEKNIFNSEDFLNNIYWSNNTKNALEYYGSQVSLYLTYSLLNQSSKGFYDFLNKIPKKDMNLHASINYLYLLFKDFANKNKEKHQNCSQEEIFKFYYTLYQRLHSVYFHGTTSYYKDSIVKNGLNPKFYDPLMNEYIELLKKYNVHDFLINNDKNLVYYSTLSINSVSYGFHSPEWFERMAYETLSSRDYEYSKKLLLEEKIPHLSEEGKNEFLRFFDKCWNIYTKANPMIIIFCNDKIKSYDEFKDYIQYFIKNDESFESNLVKVLYHITDDSYLGANIDASTANVIPPEKILICNLASYEDIMEKATIKNLTSV